MKDPFKVTEPTLISFSGGRTSAYMLWRVLQSNSGLPKDTFVVFCNTGKEDQATLDFVKRCQDEWGVPITWLEYRPNKTFTTVTYDTASRNGEPFEMIIRERKMLPNVRARFCTQALKIDTSVRYARSIGLEEWDNMIGIRADEPRRVAKMKGRVVAEHPVMPLAQAGITKHEVLEFWANQTFDLELPIIDGETIGGNCDLCFLKSVNKIIALVKQDPSRAVWWAKMEELDCIEDTGQGGNRFRIDRPKYSEISRYLNRQTEMFDDSIDCFCGD
jgi:3'-phosphoadenosine 5'-phosphosulfate sulfotransferase (PAPS reductase)/FAD synthetase